MPEYALPYDVLVIDDQVGSTSWGEIIKLRLEECEFQVKHISTLNEARSEISRAAYDIIVIDLDLQSPETGDQLQIEFRNRGLRQPVILVSGNPVFLDRPISSYANALANGPVSFYDKRTAPQNDFVVVVREVSNRVDPIRRILRLMKDAGLGNKTFNVNGGTYTVSQLLESSLTSDDLIRTLRESLYGLMLEWQSGLVDEK